MLCSCPSRASGVVQQRGPRAETVQQLGGGERARAGVERLGLGQRRAREVQLAHPARGHEHPVLQGADQRVVVLDRSMQGPAELGAVRAERAQPGIQLTADLEQLAREHRAGRSVTAEPAGSGVPRAVARALEQEIAALGEAGRRLAQGAAVAGDPVDLEPSIGRADPEGPGTPASRHRFLSVLVVLSDLLHVAMRCIAIPLP